MVKTYTEITAKNEFIRIVNTVSVVTVVVIIRVYVLTRIMAIANGTCVSFCNQPKPHYLPTSITRVTPVWRCL